ncbi:preprotein translocase subunit SecG [Solitalea canadensis]|uniref:Protein-export membrane protein SecG n=1 Tax=Solitalea canadensis (strain ATCC 29591 / DSM 3403 / JCM 21819 / LMG 8368 / NBRC 15130 / NCIMB 12057 / USAM 9D) TaxID=929556 RepID=H8KMX9_SOLCM|nr:preprotein translocase subunit SecG [Solitalea canadensis]AFD09058.1 protein translocase, SecG subunit [Solitalea canadensis DSM 3403]
MYTALVILAIFVAILLVLIVLVQNPKGGGLSSSFGGGNQMMGVQKTSDVLEKATWTLAIGLLVVSLSTNFFINRSGGEAGESAIQKQMNNTTMPAQSPAKLPAANNAAPAATPSADTSKK